MFPQLLVGDQALCRRDEWRENVRGGIYIHHCEQSIWSIRGLARCIVGVAIKLIDWYRTSATAALACVSSTSTFREAEPMRQVAVTGTTAGLGHLVEEGVNPLPTAHCPPLRALRWRKKPDPVSSPTSCSFRSGPVDPLSASYRETKPSRSKKDGRRSDVIISHPLVHDQGCFLESPFDGSLGPFLPLPLALGGRHSPKNAYYFVPYEPLQFLRESICSSVPYRGIVSGSGWLRAPDCFGNLTRSLSPFRVLLFQLHKALGKHR